MRLPWDSLHDGHRLITPQLQSKPNLTENGKTPNASCCSCEVLVKVLQQFLSKSCNEVGCCCSPPLENGELQQRCEIIFKFTPVSRPAQENQEYFPIKSTSDEMFSSHSKAICFMEGHEGTVHPNCNSRGAFQQHSNRWQD